MSPWRDAPAIGAFLKRASHRLAWIAAANGVAAGLVFALLIDRTLATGIVLAMTGAMAGVAIAAGQRRNIALLVERRAPECRNVVLTAAELIVQPDRVRPSIGERVCREAAHLVAKLDPAALFPARRALGVLGASAATWALALVAFPRVPVSGATDVANAVAVVNGIEVVVTPPAYAARAAQTLRNPARVEALAGSRVRLTVRADAGAVSIETITGKQSLAATTPGVFTGEVLADADGYISIEPSTVDRRTGVRRLVGVTVTPDHAPRVRVTAPGRDLFLPNPNRSIALSIAADDDLALASLRLRYTKVSGAGEQFTFTEGETPIAIARADDRTWTARGTLALDSLKLEAGDMIVYRAVATDRRPGAVPSESDSYIIEISAPGAIASDGFAIDEERDRYAISQQMVILKTERLIARRATTNADAFRVEALTIAAEQRQVRAEFVFMMGGELAEDVLSAADVAELDETAEAEAEDDILAGRLANQGRIDVLRSIRSMSRASAALNVVDMTKALADEKAALAYLQRAFAHNRYILRTLTQRERLDLSRRLTGVLAGVGRDTRPVADAVANPRVTALRRALAGVASLASHAELGRAEATDASALAESVLRIDASSQPLQRAAATLNDAAAAIGRARTIEAREQLDRAATALAAAIRADLLRAPPRASAFALDLLDGALTDALRRATVPR